MRRLSIIALTLSALVLLAHILFDLNNFMPDVLARISVGFFSLLLLWAALNLYSRKATRVTDGQ